jgi:hypothetical protein
MFSVRLLQYITANFYLETSEEEEEKKEVGFRYPAMGIT